MQHYSHRLSWDEYFCKFVEIAEQRSSCLRRQVGAVLVKDRAIISIAYNGAPSGIPECKVCVREGSDSGYNLDNCLAVHAEVNAILLAAKFGRSSDGAVLYCSCKPCFTCAKMLVNAGVKAVYYRDDYFSDGRTEQLFELAGVELRSWEDLRDSV